VLIVLLSLSVVLVIVMYILSRSITDISLSSKDENAMRAFSAAEAGIEKALVFGPDSGDFGEASFETSVTDFAAGQTSVVYPISLKSGELATFWFVEHDSNGNLTCATGTCFSGNQIVLRWGDEGTASDTSQTPAIELTVYYSSLVNNIPDLTTLKVARATYDPHPTRKDSNLFSVANSGVQVIGTDRFQFRRTVNLEDDYQNLGIPALDQPIYATVKMLYNTTISHKVGLATTAGTLPSQGSVIDSSGSYGDANRRISVYQLHPVVPPVFTNAIFSGSGIIK
jgi:hypothetical protein